MSISITSGTESDVQPQSQSDSADTQKTTGTEASSANAQGIESEPSGVETQTEGETNKVAPEPPKKKSGIQRLKERHAREMAEIRREISSLRTQAPSSQRDEKIAEKVDALKEPDPNNYESQVDYVRAVAKHAYALEKAQDAEKSKEAQAKQSYESQVKAHQDRVAKFRESTPDYDEVIEDFIEEHGEVHLALGLQQAIIESEEGPAVLRELLKTPGEFARVNALSPFQAAREIGRIEARLAKAPVETKEVKLTKAPKPLTPVSSNSAPVRKSIHDDDLSYTEYVRLRQESARKKA